ncbi:MAG: molybdopterin-dependent oxidoreductase, partial [Dehalococcoidia bacterium]|nr:molybdopterin-dependent oxidoreductase [Dehalococcoidia bacterium]
VKKKDPRLVAYDEKGVQGALLKRTTSKLLLSVYGAYGDPANPTGPSLKGVGALQCHIADHQFANIIHSSFICDSDLAHCNYLVTLGDNSRHCEGLGANLLASAARERGMKEVVVDPYLSATVAKADEWVPIRPATDTAFLLALIHVIINERGVYDVKFLKEMTNSPYLVGPDGYFLRDKVTKKVLVWDPIDGKAKAHDDAGIKDFALEGVYKVDGVECRPAFQVLKDHVRQYTPEWAARITDIPAATIRRIAHEYVDNARIGSSIEIEGVTLPYRPVCIKIGRGITGHMHGYQSVLASHILAALVGCLEVPGGHYGGNPIPSRTFFGLTPGDDGMTKVPTLPIIWPPASCDASETLTPFSRMWTGMMHLGFLNMVDPPKNLPVRPTEMWFRYRTNPVNSVGEPAIVEEALKKMFIVSFAFVHDEISPYADIILPDNTDLEGWALWDTFALCLGGARRSGMAIQQPVVKPQHNTMDFAQFFIELADKLGLLSAFNESVNTNLGYQQPYGLSGLYRLDPGTKYSWPEIIDRRIKTLTGGAQDLEWMKKNGAIIRETPLGEIYAHSFMKAQKLRYHVPYMDFVKRTGEELATKLAEAGIDWWPTAEYTPLPTYLPSVLDEVPAEYDFYVIKGRHMAVSYGNAESPWTIELTEALREVVDIVMNEDAAKARGIQDGDEVWVENDVGKIKRKVKLTQGIRPDTLLVAVEWGQWAMPLAKDTGRVTQAELTPIRRDWTDTLSGNMQAMAVKARVYKA